MTTRALRQLGYLALRTLRRTPSSTSAGPPARTGGCTRPAENGSWRPHRDPEPRKTVELRPTEGQHVPVRAGL